MSLLKNTPEKPPADAERYYGDPPYKNGGYTIDVGLKRWRYDKRGLVAFMIYKPKTENADSSESPFSALWTR